MEVRVQTHWITNRKAATPPGSCRASRRRPRCSSRSATRPALPTERRALEIQRAPVAILAIEVGLPVGKRGGDQPRRRRSAGNSRPRVPCWRMRDARGSRGTGWRRIGARGTPAGDIGETVIAGDFSRRRRGPAGVRSAPARYRRPHTAGRDSLHSSSPRRRRAHRAAN